MLIAVLILTLVCILAQLADGTTSYEGFFILRNSVEGDTSKFAQWIAKSPFRLFTVKPAMAALAGAIFGVAVHALPGLAGINAAHGVFAAAVPTLVIPTVMAIVAALGNYRINSKSRAGK